MTQIRSEVPGRGAGSVLVCCEGLGYDAKYRMLVTLITTLASCKLTQHSINHNTALHPCTKLGSTSTHHFLY